MLGTCSRAVVRCVLCALSGFAAPDGRYCLATCHVPWLWPAACLTGVPVGPAWCAAPRPVRSLSVLRSAFWTPWCLSPPWGLAPPALLGGCAGHAEAGREPGSLCLPLAPAKAGALGSLRVVPARGPVMGSSLAGPSVVGLRLRALRWLACVDPVTDASGSPCRPSLDGGLGRCTGAVSCARRHLPLRVRGRHARVLCGCACVPPSWPGRAGWPPGRVLVHLSFSFGRFVFLLCSAPSWLGLPLSCSFVCLPPSFFVLFFSCCTPSLSLALSGFRPRVPWALVLCFSFHCHPFLWFFSLFFSSFSFFFCAPAVSGFLWFPAPGALGPGAVCCLFCWSPASRLFVRSRCFGVSCLAVGCSLVVAAPPPPFCVSWFSSLPLGALFGFFGFFLFSLPPLLLPAGSALAGGSRRLVPPPPPSSCLFLAGLLLLGAPCALAAFVFPAQPLAASVWLPPPPFCVSQFLSLPLGAPFFFLSLLPCSYLLASRSAAALAVCRPPPPPPLPLFFVGLPLPGSPCALAAFVFPAWPLAAPWWLQPPFCVSRFSSLPLGAPFLFFSCAALLLPACLALGGGSGGLLPPESAALGR